MGKRDPRVDAYIEKSADFAKPILERFRRIVHEACPDCEETMKWSHPHFVYKGMLAGMASFKAHCAFNYWKGALVVDEDARSSDAMGQLGRIAKVSDLPPKATLVKWTKKAAALNDDGVKLERKTEPKGPLRVPPDLSAALKKQKKAQAVFDAFSPSKKRDYIEWLTEAKSAETRQRRLATAVDWIGEGKSRNWKYEKC
jgi:uncharacterized protein YdeI (YjbR/CyaY-like superfamily)